MTDHTQHVTIEQIRRFLNERDSSPNEAAVINAHMAGCSQCRQTFRNEMPDTAVRTVIQLTSPADDFACLDPDLIARYVDGTTDTFENERVDIHLQDCEFCTADVADLRMFRENMEAALRQDLLEAKSQSLPDMNAAVAANVQNPEPADLQSVSVPVSWRQRLRAWFIPESTRPLFPLMTGAALAACVIFMALAIPMWMQLRREREGQDRRIAALETEITAEKRNAARADQQQAQLSRMQQDLTRTRHELMALQDRERRDMLVKTTAPPLNGLKAPASTGSDVAAQPFPSAYSNYSKYLEHPQLALNAGVEQLGSIAAPHRQVLGNPADTPQPELLAPTACIVSSQRPRFRWRPLQGARSYRVEIRVLDSGAEISPDAPITATMLDLTQPLTRNLVYTWQVVALDQNNMEMARSANAKFKILDEKSARDLRRYAGLPLARSVIYIQAGMPTEAEAELQKYKRQNPGSIQAQQLENVIQELKRKAREAAKLGQ